MEQYLDSLASDLARIDNAHKKFVLGMEDIPKEMTYYPKTYGVSEADANTFSVQASAFVQNSKQVIESLNTEVQAQKDVAVSLNSEAISAAKLISDGLLLPTQVHQLAKKFLGDVAALKLLDAAATQNKKYKDVNLKNYWVQSEDVFHIRDAIVSRNFAKASFVIQVVQNRIKNGEIQEGVYLGDLI